MGTETMATLRRKSPMPTIPSSSMSSAIFCQKQGSQVQVQAFHEDQEATLKTNGEVQDRWEWIMRPMTRASLCSAGALTSFQRSERQWLRETWENLRGSSGRRLEGRTNWQSQGWSQTQLTRSTPGGVCLKIERR